MTSTMHQDARPHVLTHLQKVNETKQNSTKMSEKALEVAASVGALGLRPRKPYLRGHLFMLFENV